MRTIYKGEPAKGLDFYNLLFESSDFNIELGKVTLTSGKLEAELILFLKRNEMTVNSSRMTLGALIDKCKKQNLFNKNLITALKEVSKQRNYLMHNIYALHSDLLDETILVKINLLDTDVLLYTERAWQLQENLIQLAEIIKKQSIL